MMDQAPQGEEQLLWDAAELTQQQSWDWDAYYEQVLRNVVTRARCLLLTHALVKLLNVLHYLSRYSLTRSGTLTHSGTLTYCGILTNSHAHSLTHSLTHLCTLWRSWSGVCVE